MNRWLTLAMVFLSMILLTGGALRAAPTARGDTPRPEVGYPAPDLTLTGADGAEWHLADLRGEAVFLNFWASWCGPCLMEMPAVQALHDQQRAGFRVVAVNMTSTEASPAAVVRFLAANGYTFATPLDVDGQAARSYNVISIPTSFFIDRDGIIRFKVIGPMSLGAMRDYLRAAAKGG